MSLGILYSMVVLHMSISHFLKQISMEAVVLRVSVVLKTYTSDSFLKLLEAHK